MRACLLLLMFLLAVVESASAQSWYLGVAGGVSRADESELQSGYGQDAVRIPGRNFTGRSIQSSYFDQANGAWQAFGGWHITRFVALELRYADYGTQRLGYTGIRGTCCGSPVLDPHETRDGRREVTAWGIDVVGTLPLTSTLDAVAGIGAARVRTKLDAGFTSSPGGLGPTTSGSSSVSDSSTTARIQVGLNWAPLPPWTFRVSYEFLGKAGSSFDPDGEHTGRSSQQTVWIGLQRDF